VLYRNTGELYWKELKDYKKAQLMYEKAVLYSPLDYRLYVALDELYSINKAHFKRESLFINAPEKVKSKFSYKLKRAQYYIDTGKYDNALEILSKNTFLPWEGWTKAHRVYVLALLRRGTEFISDKRYKLAIKDFTRAMEYPENLGTGRPANPEYAREYYFIGICYEKMGKKKKAEKYFRKSANETASIYKSSLFFEALSLIKTRERKAALRLLKKQIDVNQKNIRLSWKENSNYYLNMAMAYSALGKKEKADEYFEKALEINPSDRWIIFYNHILTH
jgi:tetratricopeptide (TPR) repeat protein